MSDDTKVESTNKKITFRLVISWIIGVVLLVIGVIFLFILPITGILILIAAAITLPPIDRIAKEKLKLSLSAPLKFIVVLILVIAAPLIGDVREKAIEEGIVLEETDATSDIPSGIDVQPVQPVPPPQQIPPSPQPTVEPTPQPVSVPKTYQEIFSFSGNGAKQSEPFLITGNRFKIKYDCNGDLCQAFLRSTESEFGVDIIMNVDASIQDETIFYGAGEYYIEANTIGSYTMTVEDYR